MGRVYEAENVRTGSRVAVKILTNTESTAALDRFRREARAASAVSSAHIVKTYDMGVDPATGAPYIVMEHLRGTDLSSALKAHGGRLSPPAAVEIVCQALAALEQAHRVGVVHRDIKPSNIFLSQERSDELTVRVLDFGIAKVTNAAVDANHTLTATGEVLGSPRYMSPEQIQGLPNVDGQTDVWSMGVVLYLCLTGQAPHEEDNIGRTLLMTCTRRAPSVIERAPWVEAGLARVVEQALCISRKERIASALDFRNALLPFRKLSKITLDSLRDASHADGGWRFPSTTAREEIAGEADFAVDPSTVAASRDKWTIPRRKLTAVGALVAAGALAVGAAAVGFARPRAALRNEVVPSTEERPVESAALKQRDLRTGIVELRRGRPADCSHNGAPCTWANAEQERIRVDGYAGSTHRIELRYGDAATTYEIVMSEMGPKPSAIGLLPSAAPNATAQMAARPVGSPREQRAAPVAAPTNAVAPAHSLKPAEQLD